VPTSPAASSADPVPKRRRNWWVWISGVLALLVIGLLVWALATRSDLDSSQDELADTQQQLDKAKLDLEQQQQAAEEPADEGGAGGALVAAGGLVAAKKVYDDLTQQLGATEKDLAETEQDLADANAAAEQAEQDAASAEKQVAEAGDETDKAQAEADKAKADAKAAESKATVVADCARAYLGAFGALFEGDDVEAQATKVREQLEGITDECEAALGEA